MASVRKKPFVMRTALLGLALCCVVAVAVCDEDMSVSYASFADAERAGADARGWIPEFVPRSATEIVEAHNLDTNLQRLRFLAAPEVLEKMAGKLTALPVRELRPSRRLPRIAGRWPRSLDEGSASPETLRAYRSPATRDGRVFCIAIDAGASTAYVWSCSD